MTVRQTAAAKVFNQHHIEGGIILDGNDEDGDLWRGCIVTGVAETTMNNLDIHADGEGVSGVLVGFGSQYAIDIDSANSVANRACQYALRGSGAYVYTYHDANATDAIVMGANITASTTVAGYADLGTDIVVDHLGISAELLTMITTTYYAFKVLIQGGNMNA